jgi:hypothetical protein
MSKTRLSVSLASLATLAACGGYDTVTPAGQAVTTAPGAVVTAPAPPGTIVTTPGTVVQPGAVVQPGTAVVVAPTAGVRPGVGRVESNNRLSLAGGEDRPVRRLGVRMSDGVLQYVDTRAQNIAIGDRVELTADNHILYGMGPLPPR